MQVGAAALWRWGWCSRVVLQLQLLGEVCCLRPAKAWLWPVCLPSLIHTCLGTWIWAASAGAATALALGPPTHVADRASFRTMAQFLFKSHHSSFLEMGMLIGHILLQRGCV